MSRTAPMRDQAPGTEGIVRLGSFHWLQVTVKLDFVVSDLPAATGMLVVLLPSSSTGRPLDCAIHIVPMLVVP